MINKYIIDCSHTRTDLCGIGAAAGTDKSPFSQSTPSGHRHAYTAIYDLLFSPFRGDLINFGEIGIERNDSMRMWRAYFPHAHLVGWEYEQAKIEKAESEDLPFVYYLHMDVTSESSIREGFQKAARQFKVLIEDSTHRFEDQLRVVSLAHEVLLPGGYLVIEDVFKNRAEADYEAAIAPYRHYYSSVFFIEPLHAEQFSGDWNNDKLLVLCRGED